MQVDMRYEAARRYFLRVPESQFDGCEIPDILINRIRKNGHIECQTMELMKLNQKIEDSHQEVVLMSDKTIQTLLDNIRGEIQTLFKVCESVALLDMIAGFVQLATTGEEYVRPEITECIAIKAGRHPVKEKVNCTPRIMSRVNLDIRSIPPLNSSPMMSLPQRPRDFRSVYFPNMETLCSKSFVVSKLVTKGYSEVGKNSTLLIYISLSSYWLQYVR